MITEPLIDVFIVDLGAARDALEAEERGAPRLSAEDIARFDHKARALGTVEARDWRAAHIALRIILEREAGSELRGIAFDRDPGGWPRVPRSLDLPRYPEFSLAHAGEAALIALSRDGAVGADIEVPRDVRMSDERRAGVIRAAARLAPGLALPEDADACLLQSWVRLEAIAKATGLGIGRILTEAGVVGGSKSDNVGAGPAYHVSVADLALGPDRFAAVAAAGRLPNIAIHTFATDAAALAAFKMRGA